MPVPSSSTISITPPSWPKPRTQIFVPSGVWRIAFESRFSRIRSTFAASTDTVIDSTSTSMSRSAGILRAVHAAVDELRQIGRPALRADDASLQPVEVEQVRQQPLELAGVRGDAAHQVERVLLRQLELRLLERERRAQDRGQRRPQVVRDGLQERVLHLVERAQPLRGLALAPERLRVLPLAPPQRLLGALALGDVDHQAAELARSLRARAPRAPCRGSRSSGRRAR